jgi:hypothetical protein
MRRKFAHLGALAVVLTLVALVMLAAPAAQAFTLGGETAGGNKNYEVPKFDLEEQAKNFRSGGAGGTTPGKTELNTPIGTMQFGVQQGPRSAFGPGSMGPASGSRVNRADFERMVTPDSLR